MLARKLMAATGSHPMENWTTQNSGSDQDLNDVVWNGSIFVAVGNYGKIITSSDGITWTSRTSGTTTSNFEKIYWLGGKFIAVGGADGGTMAVSSSYDGIYWNYSSGLPGGAFKYAAWNGTHYIIAGSSGNVWRSNDAVTWSYVTNLNLCRSLIYANSIFVLLTDTDIKTSTDGVTWTSRKSGTYLDITWASYQFVAVGQNGAIATSSNGINWSGMTSGTTVMLINVTYGDSLMVAGGQNGLILTSSNGGETWAIRRAQDGVDIDNLKWLNNQYIGVRWNGGIIVSNDGIAWDSFQIVSETYMPLFGVTYGASKYVVTGYNGKLLTHA